MHFYVITHIHFFSTTIQKTGRNRYRLLSYADIDTYTENLRTRESKEYVPPVEALGY
jgi:hypothetical protein